MISRGFQVSLENDESRIHDKLRTISISGLNDKIKAAEEELKSPTKPKAKEKIKQKLKMKNSIVKIKTII